MGTPLLLLVRRGLTRSWAGWLFVSLLTALTITGAGGAFAVSRQTLTAYPRLLDSIDAPDLSFGIGNPDHPDWPPAPLPPEELLTVDGVAELRILRLIQGTEVDSEGNPFITDRTGIMAAVSGTPSFPLLRGSWPAADSVDEVAISTDAVPIVGADLGDTFRFIVATVVMDQADMVVTSVELKVVGVFGPATADGPAEDPTTNSLIITGPAFLSAHPRVGLYQVANIWLKDDTTVESFQRSLEERFGTVEVTTREQLEADALKIMRPEAYAVVGIGIAAVLVGLIVTALAIARQTNDGSDELSYLALGLARRQRALQRWAQALVAIAVGTALGLAGAFVVARSLGAIGVADAFDHTPAHTSDLGVVWGTGFGLAVVLMLFAAVLSWHNSRIVRALPSVALAPAWLLAVRRAVPQDVRTGAALAGKGTGAHRAVRAAIVGTVAAVAISGAVITFTSSLDTLVSTPALYGDDYNLSAFDQYGFLDDDVITGVLSADSEVVDIARAAGSSGSISGREADLIGLDNFAVGPRLTSGSAPNADNELLLGRRLARRINAGIGDQVTVVVGETSQTYRVAGIGVLPGSTGDGAAFTPDGLLRVAPESEVASQFVRLRPGADADAVIQRYGDALGCQSNCDLVAPSPPADLAYLDRVGDLPRWAVATVIVLGVAMSIQALLVVGRRSRRSIAVLRSIGATRGQVTRYLLSQALLIVVIGAGVGLAVGVLIGRIVWSRFADGLGVVPQSTNNLTAIAAALGLLVIITIASSAIPAWRSAHRSVAPELRAD